MFTQQNEQHLRQQYRHPPLQKTQGRGTQSLVREKKSKPKSGPAPSLPSDAALPLG